MTATELAERFQVPEAVARLAISRGIAELCAELAARDSDPRKAFIAAVNVLSRPRRRPGAELPRFRRSVAELVAHATPDDLEDWSRQFVDDGLPANERLLASELLAEAEGDFAMKH